MEGHILVAEDHEVVSWAYKLLFQLHFPKLVCTVTESWKDTEKELYRTDRAYEMVLLDLQLSDINVVPKVEQLLTDLPQLKILVASTSPEKLWGSGLLKLGVKGYFDKSAPTEELVHAIKTVLEGSVYKSK
ncbi:response regulator [Taibaiella chishuiensis]|uniref:Response regulator receiver domain-containing protein n=1 Tax=Taibaiella chishuiensis TaxID=1434707 RepID=A0A2P8DA55_9BACT|nr:response regulator transcription factor [Taibaiella chishuiensis]PSK94095.1 response regulator receiver domain-containing protein [Taibaiella chishuiensis]